jgi:hypothetical protein
MFTRIANDRMGEVDSRSIVLPVSSAVSPVYNPAIQEELSLSSSQRLPSKTALSFGSRQQPSVQRYGPMVPIPERGMSNFREVHERVTVVRK